MGSRGGSRPRSAAELLDVRGRTLIGATHAGAAATHARRADTRASHRSKAEQALRAKAGGGSKRPDAGTRGAPMHRTTPPNDGLAIPHDIIPRGAAREQLAEWQRAGLSVHVYYRLGSGAAKGRWMLQIAGRHEQPLDRFLTRYARAVRRARRAERRRRSSRR